MDTLDFIHRVYVGIPCASRDDGFVFEPTPSTDQVYHKGEKKTQAKSKTKDKTDKNSPGVHLHLYKQLSYSKLVQCY